MAINSFSLLYSARLSSPKSVTSLNRKQNNILAYEFIIREHREKIELMLFFNHEIILCYY